MIELTSRAFLSLQWGHAVIGVDTVVATGQASESFRLQWGHAVIGVDTLWADLDVAGPAQLQWGHAVIGVDTADGLPRATRLRRGFNGATP